MFKLLVEISVGILMRLLNFKSYKNLVLHKLRTSIMYACIYKFWLRAWTRSGVLDIFTTVLFSSFFAVDGAPDPTVHLSERHCIFL